MQLNFRPFKVNPAASNKRENRSSEKKLHMIMLEG